MITAQRAHLFFATATHPGMKGKNNEDRFAISAYTVDERRRTPSVLTVVSDGIGGHRAGEVAAEIAVNVITQVVAGSDASRPESILQEAIIKASETIRGQAETDPLKKGMGATCVCAWIIGSRLYTASVGDSRIYLIRQGAIQRLSTDHTWVQEAIEHGALSPDQARNHPNAHVIRRYLGSQQLVVPDLRLRLQPGENDSQAEANQGARLLPDDRLVLCTDGLTDLVDDPEILEAVETMKLDDAVQYLVDLANQRGGHDNITLVILEVPATGITQMTGSKVESTQPITATPVMEATQPVATVQAAQAVQAATAEQTAVQEVHEEKKGVLQGKALWMALSCLGIITLSGLAVALFGTVSWFAIHPTPTSTPAVTQTRAVPFTVQPTLPAIFVSATPQPTGTVAPLTPPAFRPTYTPWPTSTPTPTPILPPVFLASPKPPD